MSVTPVPPPRVDDGDDVDDGSYVHDPSGDEALPYIHDPAGDTALPYVHDPSGDEPEEAGI